MVGNRVFGHSLILCVAAALLFAPWGSLRATQSQPTDATTVVRTNNQAQSAETLVLVHGLQGHVAIGKVIIAYWMIIALLALGCIVSCLNLLSWTRLSSVVTFALFGMSAACSLVAIIHFAYHGEVGTGSVLAMTCAFAGLALSPSDEPAQRAEIHKLEPSSRSLRRAA